MKRIVLSFFLVFFSALTCKVQAKEALMDNRPERMTYISSFIKPNAIGAELGVYRGVFAFHCLLKRDPERLFLIDPWEPYYQMDNLSASQKEREDIWNIHFQEVCEIFDPYPNVEIIREKSENVFSMFEDEFFDYVYIDGEHSYEAVARDLENYHSKVKIGGYIMGDDYGWVGVAPAVQNFLKRNRGKFQLVEDPCLSKSAGQYVLKRIA